MDVVFTLKRINQAPLHRLVKHNNVNLDSLYFLNESVFIDSAKMIMESIVRFRKRKE